VHEPRLPNRKPDARQLLPAMRIEPEGAGFFTAKTATQPAIQPGEWSRATGCADLVRLKKQSRGVSPRSGPARPGSVGIG